MDTGEFYQHRDIFDKCQSCRNCLDKGYLLTPFENRRLPLPWQGSVGPRVKLLFLFARPSFTKLSPRLSDYPNAPALRAMLDGQYESHAIAFKRRRSVDGSIRAHARKITSILLETPENTISDFDDYLFTSLLRCDSDRKQDLASLELLASECLGLHGRELLGRLPNLQWIVLVGSTSHRLLSRPGAWMKFRKAVHTHHTMQNQQLPPLVAGVSNVIALNDRLHMIAVPHFNRSVFRPEHYRLIFASWMTRPLSKKADASGPLRGAPRAANPN